MIIILFFRICIRNLILSLVVNKLLSAFQWIVDEALDKKKIKLDPSTWKVFDRESGVPQQRNCYDCGMFSIFCADTLSDDLPLSSYSQDDMVENRYKVAAAILRGQLSY